MEYEKILIKYYQNSLKRKKYGLLDLAPSFQYEDIIIDNVTKYKAKIELNNEVVISTDHYYENKNIAKNECSKKVIEFFFEIKYSLNEKKNEFFYYLLLILIGVGFIVQLYFIKNYIKYAILFFYCILISPYFIRDMEIGTCVGVDVMVSKSSTIDNIFEKNILYITIGDLVLINKVALPSEKKPYYFEAILTKDLDLLQINNEKKTLYKLEKNTSIRVNKDINKNGEMKYSIKILSYENDGLEKYFLNDNVNKDCFFSLDNFEKYHVFSKHGNHVVHQRFIETSNLESLNWYFVVLSIYYEYFITSFNYYFYDTIKSKSNIQY